MSTHHLWKEKLATEVKAIEVLLIHIKVECIQHRCGKGNSCMKQK